MNNRSNSNKTVSKDIIQTVDKKSKTLIKLLFMLIRWYILSISFWKRNNVLKISSNQFIFIILLLRYTFDDYLILYSRYHWKLCWCLFIRFSLLYYLHRVYIYTIGNSDTQCLDICNLYWTEQNVINESKYSGEFSYFITLFKHSRIN